VRIVQWSLILGALLYALLFWYFAWSGGAAYLLAVLPVALAYMAARTWLAGAFMLLLPMYFVIGTLTAAQPHYQPFVGLDHAMPLWPEWILVYASLYVSAFILPLIVVRGRSLFQQTLKAYLFVMMVSYAGFVLYPTIAPRNDDVYVHDFASWTLQLFYDIDQPFGCFPSLHVAYSFVATLACFRTNRAVGIAAGVWSTLIAVSTVYTKQHFVVDAIAGTAIGLASYPLFLRERPGQTILAVDRDGAPRRVLYAAAVYAVMVVAGWAAYRLGLGPLPD
jgi:membrane-associated phospholipid phosphatase